MVRERCCVFFFFLLRGGWDRGEIQGRGEVGLTKREGGKSPFRLYSELSTQMMVDSRTMACLREEWAVRENTDGERGGNV